MGFVRIFIAVMFTLFVAALAGLSLLGQNLEDTSQGLEIQGFQVAAYEHSLSINHDRHPTSYYKISPYDDALIFQTGANEFVTEKLAMAGESVQGGPEPKPNEFDQRWQFWQKLVGQVIPTVEFFSQGKYTVQYRGEKSDAAVTIKKTVNGLVKPAAGYLHSLGFSNDDLVFDSRQILYSNNFNSRLTDLLGLVPVVEQTSNQIVVGPTEYMVVFNPHLDYALVLRPRMGQRVTVDRVYRLITVTEMFDQESSDVSVAQTISFVSIDQLINLAGQENSFGALIHSQ